MFKEFQKIDQFHAFPELSLLAGKQSLIECYLSLVGCEVGMAQGKLCIRSAGNSLEESQGEYSVSEATPNEIVELAIAIASGMRMSDEEKRHHLRKACMAQVQLEREIDALKKDIHFLKGGKRDG